MVGAHDRRLIISRASLRHSLLISTHSLNIGQMILHEPSILFLKLAGHGCFLVGVAPTMIKLLLPISRLLAANSMSLPRVFGRFAALAGLADDNLMCVMTEVTLIQHLILSLDLLVVWQLSGVIHANFSSLIKIHIARGV